MDINYKLSHLMEYIGIRSGHYGHTPSPNRYDPNDPSIYYLDQSFKADFHGAKDDKGLPLSVAGKKGDYYPIDICLFALGNFESYRISGNSAKCELFKESCEWLLKNQDPAGVWLTHHDVKKVGLKAPWQSALALGLGMSCLTRGYSLFEDGRYLDSAVSALRPYHLTIDKGGVASSVDGMPFYDEYPSLTGFHVLNGFIFSLWGLLDMIRIVQNQDAVELYGAGLNTLKRILPHYDIGYWSLYHISDGIKNPASVPYHRLHIDQLDALYCIEGDGVFAHYRDLWQGYLNGRFNALRSLPRKLLWNAIYGF